MVESGRVQLAELQRTSTKNELITFPWNLSEPEVTLDPHKRSTSNSEAVFGGMLFYLWPSDSLLSHNVKLVQRHCLDTKRL